jgi:hypothetical protein
MMNWQPSYRLDDALRETIQWYRDYFEMADGGQRLQRSA